MFVKCALLTVSLLLAHTEAAGTSTSSSDAQLGCYANNTWYKKMEQRAVDETIDPCVDFHSYACGMWRVPYELRAHSSNVHDTLSAMKADNRRQLIAYFDNTAAKLTAEQQRTELPPHHLALVRFYGTCMEAMLVDPSLTSKTSTLGNINSNGTLSSYVRRLRHINSDWLSVIEPVLINRSAVNVGFHWEQVAAQLRRYGVDSLWRLVVQSNWQAAEQQILYMVPPAFDMLRRHASATKADDDSLYLYKQYVKHIMLGLGVRVRKSIQLADEVVSFEEELLALASSTADSVVLNEPQTLVSLAHEFPDMQLLQYFNALLHNITPAAPGRQSARRELDIERVLIVANKRYLRKLSQKLQQTNTATLAKWLMVQFFSHFEVLLHNGNAFKDSQQHCLRQVNEFLPNELTALFLELQPHGGSAAWWRSTEADLKRLFEQLKVQFEALLNETTIFEHDTPTKILGLEKLQAMRLLLPAVQSVKDLHGHGFDVEASYDENLLNLSLTSARTQLAQLYSGDLSPATSATTNYGPLQVNAYYRLKKNAIELPIGLLRAPFYDSCLPAPRVYGSLVYVLGHELLHAFDYDGLNYDESGNVANSWSPKVIVQFGRKAMCFFDERFEDAPAKINENIADSEGLRLALEAFKQQQTKPSTEALQLFFLSFAQTWCNVDISGATDAAAGAGSGGSSITKEHADHRDRVNNALGNFDEFMEAYRCHTGSFMNPMKKCRIW